MSTPFTHTHGDRSYSGRTNIGDAGFARSAGVPLVIALHGGSYTSKYFDVPGYSLLDRASAQGIPVIALDRPNFGDSTPLESEGSIIIDNAAVLSDAIGSIWEQYGGDAPGVVIIAHSIGGAVTTAIAASQPAWPLLGISISGCLVRVPPESREAWKALPPITMVDLPVPIKEQVMFGPADTLAADMPAASHVSNALVPKAELLDITGDWIERRAEVCSRVTVPVHHRQGEFDALWITDQDEIDEFRAGFSSAASIDTALLPGSGHCIDFHVPSGEFQESQLAFALQTAQAAA